MADLASDFIRDAQDAEQAESADCPECGHSSGFLGYLGGLAGFCCRNRRCSFEFQVALTTVGG